MIRPFLLRLAFYSNPGGIMYPVLIYSALSILLFVLMALDKGFAKSGHRRVREKTLLLLGFFGGAPGGLLGIYLCHHKTRKMYFALTYIASCLVHMISWLYIYDI